MSARVLLRSGDDAERAVHDVSDAPRERNALRVLIVEADRALREGCAGFFRTTGCSVHTARSGPEALERVHAAAFDLVLVDLDLSPDGAGLVGAIHVALPSALVVVTTGTPAIEANADVVRNGAWEYLLKPFTPDHLGVLLGRAIQATAQSSSEGARTRGGTTFRAASPAEGRTSCVGTAPAFRAAVEMALRVAPSDASVMIYGESGTGKEVIANLIHRHSRRSAKPLVPVNCAALPEALLESELLGHRRGAFTGAEREKVGLLETAHGGTFLLDEFTEMSPRLQAKLLRVVQDGIVRRVGSEQNDAQVDVRFVSATNVEPHEAVRRGLLRKDLFYRLRVVLIKLPALRDRPEDVPLLAQHFLASAWRKFRGHEHRPPCFAPSTLSFLASRPWYGNVRELQNVVEYLAVMAQPGATLRVDEVPCYDEPVESGGEITIPRRLLERDYYPGRDEIVAEFDRLYLSRLVVRAGGNLSKASRIASMDRTTLYRLVERYGIVRRDDEIPASAMGEQPSAA